ncbi:MAG: hypothetical protein JSU07_03145 [Bacteroidetes bacterium]|nr:hypothetical protein [Bacteroidota bacterium]
MNDLRINKNKLVVVFFILPLFYFTQNTFITELENINTDIKADPSVSKTISYFYENSIYFLNPDYNDGKELLIYSYNLSFDKVKRNIRIKNTKVIYKLFSQRIFSFAIQNDLLIILTDPSIFIFKIEGDYAKNLKVIKNQKAAFNKIKLLNNNEFLLYVYYNFHPMDAPIKHVWAKFNTDKLVIENMVEHNDEEAVYSHMINEWVSTYKGVIAHSSTLKYNIQFFNSKFEAIDSITSNKLDNNKKLLPFIPTTVSSKEDIRELMKKDDSLLTRIQKIFLLDSSTLMVMLKLPKTRDCEFDLWKKKENKWHFYKTEKLETFYKTNQAYNNSNNKLNALYGNSNAVCIGKNQMIYVIYTPFINDIITDDFNLNKDYNEKINKMIREDKTYYGLRKIKILH